MEVEKSLTIKLYLNHEEARWLKQAMQNPLYGQHPSEEAHDDIVMRNKFWGALPPLEELNGY